MLDNTITSIAIRRQDLQLLWLISTDSCICCADEKRVVDSLFIVNWTGTLMEYILEPRAKSGLEKVTDESPIEVLARAWAQWPLARSVSQKCLFFHFFLVVTFYSSRSALRS